MTMEAPINEPSSQPVSLIISDAALAWLALLNLHQRRIVAIAMEEDADGLGLKLL